MTSRLREGSNRVSWQTGGIGEIWLASWTGTRKRRVRWQAPRGPRRVWGGGWRYLCAAWATRHYSALQAPLDLLTVPSAAPSSPPPLIDWPACKATLGKLGPAGGTREGAGGGGGAETGGSSQGRDGRKPGCGVGSGAAKSTS